MRRRFLECVPVNHFLLNKLKIDKFRKNSAKCKGVDLPTLTESSRKFCTFLHLANIL